MTFSRKNRLLSANLFLDLEGSVGLLLLVNKHQPVHIRTQINIQVIQINSNKMVAKTVLHHSNKYSSVVAHKF